MTKAKPINILAVDDHADNRLVMETILADFDWNVMTAASGVEALRKALKMDFAVILMDVAMPEMDGFEAAALIRGRERSRNTPIIFVTGLDKSDEYVARGYALGAVDYIYKPFHPGTLKAKVRVFTDLFQARQALIESEARLRLLNDHLEEQIVERTRAAVKAETRFRALVETIPAVVYSFDVEQNKFVFVSSFAESILGVTPGDLVRDPGPWAKRILPEDVNAVRHNYERTRELGLPFESECRVFNGQGKIHWLHTCGRIITEGRKKSLMLGVAMDITAKKEAELALKEANEKLEEKVRARTMEISTQKHFAEQARFEALTASRAKSDFLANMSHELRTPLNSILGFSEVLADELYGGLNDKQKEYVENIHRAGNHLLSLINDILDLSKVEAGKMELEISSFHVGELLSAVMTMFQEKASRRAVTLSLALDLDERTQLSADERKIKQILFNLLSNAIKFTPDGGKIKVTAHRCGEDTLEISVSDTGIGIKEADLGKLFREFQQIDSTLTKQYEGTGLGLALSRKLTELHGGEIRAESTFGQGSRFTFRIPLKQPEGGRGEG